LPALLGFAIALQTQTGFDILYFFLAMIAIICNHLALNMTDDYYDFLHGTDVLDLDRKNQYSGGSGVLVSKEMSTSTMKIAFFVFYCITIMIGLYLTIRLGWIILLFGMIGVFSSYFYTAPPIKFAYRGFGEIAILINLGPLITIGSYYVATQSISMEIAILSLPLGLLVFAQILANELPDYIDDGRSSKRTLVVIFGKKLGLNLIIIATILAYASVLVSVLIGIAPKIILISLSSIYMAYKSIRLLSKTLHDKHIEGNLEMMKTHHFTAISLICAYCIEALINGKNISSIMIILLTLLSLYLPVIMHFKRTRQ